mgnify:CR=1 FL=1
MWQRFAFLEYTLIGDRTSVSTTLKCGTNGYKELIEKGVHVIYKFAKQGGFGNAANL